MKLWGAALAPKGVSFLLSLGLLAAAWISASAQQPGPAGSGSGAPDSGAEVIRGVVSGVKQGEHALYLYERIERVESRKDANDNSPTSIRVSRVVPAGTGITKIPLGEDGKPTDADAYRVELTKLLNSLTWAAEPGQSQRDAYQKVQKKQRDRDDLIEATRSAFTFTFLSHEPRGDRMLSKYRMEPNPAFRSTNRATAVFAKVKGLVWVDDASHELARVEGEVTEDIAVGGFLAKVYRGSHFMQERYEMAPGLWLPSFTQYDFDGRKFFSSFGVHEKTFVSGYKRIGTPAEAIPQIQAEIAELSPAKAKAAENR